MAIMVIEPVHAQQDGSDLFDTYCANCHEAIGEDVALGPGISTMRQMTPEYILEVMNNGVMQPQAAERSRSQRHILSEYLSGKKLGEVPEVIPKSAYCSNEAPSFQNTLTGPTWNSWGGTIINTRFQPTEVARLKPEDIPHLKLKWAFGYPGTTSGGTQPVVVGGRLYVGSPVGDVFSIDAKTGCVHWMIQVDAGVRSAITIGKPTPEGHLMAYFADQAANVYGVDAETGSLVWKIKIDKHPRAVVTAAPTLHMDRLYVPVSSREESQVDNPKYPCCQFRGSINALDAKDGNVMWRTYTIEDEAEPIGKNSIGTQLYGPSGVPIWNAPTIDVKRKLLYIGTGNNYSIPATKNSDAIMAFDLDSGNIRWVNQTTGNDIWNSHCMRSGQSPYVCPDPDAPDTDYGNSPVLVERNGRDILLAGNKLGLVYAFDPDNDGAILWQASTGKGDITGGIMWGLAADNEKVYAGNAYFNKAEPAATGGVSAIDIESGRTVWSVAGLPCTGRDLCKSSYSAAVTVIPGVVFAGTMDGRFSALSTENGETLWQYDTARGFETVNGVKANGGSMSNAGATVVDGLVYVNSGYSHHRAIIPGNVLLVFSAE